MRPGLYLLLVITTVQLAFALNAPVTQINAAAAGDSVDVILTWSSVPGATGYLVYMTADPLGVGELLARVSGTQFNDRFAGDSFFYVMAEDTSAALPTVPAPLPEHPEAEVISLFSNVYTDIPVHSWSAEWDQADVEDVQIEGDDVKLYSDLTLAVIELAVPYLNLTGMTHLHLDIWTPDPTALPALFEIQLVDFGTDCDWPIDDAGHQLTFDENSDPPLQTASWISFDIPLSDFQELVTREHLARLLLAGDPNTLYLDNLYFYGVVPATAPSQPAPLPSHDPASVVSLFSDLYTDVPVDTWSADWDQADVEDYQVAGDAVKLYTGLSYAGIEFITQTIDATDLTDFHLDIWTPDPTALPRLFWIRLVDFGADGVYGGGDDVEDTINIDAGYDPPLETGVWISLDIPLSDFEGLITREHLAQLLIGGDPDRVFLDNVYFRGQVSGGGTEPEIIAPLPEYPDTDVISLFSNVYADVPVGEWSTTWDQADVEDFQLPGDDIKLYTNLVFAAAQFSSQTIDASGMTHFRLDFWTPDPTAAPAVFRIKLVDFGADGLYGGGDDVESELDFDQYSDPPLQTGIWITFDIPLSAFTGLITREHLAQLLISGDPDTVFVDNVLFHR